MKVYKLEIMPGYHAGKKQELLRKVWSLNGELLRTVYHYYKMPS